MDKNEMLTRYAARSAAHVYALGFTHSGCLYVVKLSLAELSRFVKLDRASSKRGGFAKLRVKLTAAERAELSSTAELLGADYAEKYDRFDLAQLRETVAVCRSSRNQAEAGKKLFAVSRLARRSVNDSDRLGKYLAKFGLDFAAVKNPQNRNNS